MENPEENKEAILPESEVSETTQNSVERERIVFLEKSLQECQDKYLRLLAESENTRKRMQKERQDLTKYAVENLIVDFLHPLDSFEKALQFAENMSEDVKNWAIGFEMILNQFKQALINHGVTDFESVGNGFDPHLHEAVEMVETTQYPPGKVVHEFLRGYRMGDRIIRPARVKVAKMPENSEKNES